VKGIVPEMPSGRAALNDLLARLRLEHIFPLSLATSRRPKVN